MKNSIMIIGLVLFSSGLWGQTVGDSLFVRFVPFHGNAIIQHGKHVSLRKVKRLGKDIPEIGAQIKRIRWRRVNSYPVALIAGITIGSAPSWFRTNPVMGTTLLIAGTELTVFLLHTLKDEKRDMIRITKLYNQNLK